MTASRTGDPAAMRVLLESWRAWWTRATPSTHKRR